MMLLWPSLVFNMTLLSLKKSRMTFKLVYGLLIVRISPISVEMAPHLIRYLTTRLAIDDRLSYNTGSQKKLEELRFQFNQCNRTRTIQISQKWSGGVLQIFDNFCPKIWKFDLSLKLENNDSAKILVI